MKEKIFNWIKKNKVEFLILVSILIIASFFRFYNLAGYMTFLGDEGRDALIIKKLLTEGDVPFIGAPTSVGNIYLGPFYYYMMALPMLLFWLNPVAAAAQVALIGVITVGLIYYLSRSWFSREAAIVASFLYAISPINIIYSKSSWNPNPAPFFTLLAVLGIYKAHQTKNFWWFILTGFALGAVIQMHYLALILLPVFFILWLIELKRNYFDKLKIKHLLSGTFLALLVFFILIFPLILFDFKHYFLNTRAMMELFTGSDSVETNLIARFSRVIPIYLNSLIGDYMSIGNYYVKWLIGLLTLTPLLINIFNIYKKRYFNWVYLLLGIWLVIGLMGLSLYKGEIYSHYLGFLNPTAFILIGAMTSLIWSYRSKVVWLISGIWIIVLLWLVGVNLQKNPLQNPPNNQLVRTQQIAKFVIDKTEKRPFNFALIAENNYDAAYQFYLEVYGYKPKRVPFEKTDQLLIVCEDKSCQPINHPKQEIADFGYAKISEQYDIEGVKVFKLIPNPSGKP
jgi:4-amino-4-deoxy-L-arabinose transferase-like glycosyltransferase